MSEVVPWIAVVTSAFSVIVAIFLGTQTHKFRKDQFKISREREIYDWASKTLEIFSDLKSGDLNRIRIAKGRLSAQIDLGRLLFPNDYVETRNVHRPEERRGVRSEVIHPLICVYDLDEKDGEIEEKLGGLQRKFIYEVGKRFTPVATGTSPAAQSRTRMKAMEGRQ